MAVASFLLSTSTNKPNKLRAEFSIHCTSMYSIKLSVFCSEKIIHGRKQVFNSFCLGGESVIFKVIDFFLVFFLLKKWSQ